MQRTRRYTTVGADPFASFTFGSYISRIANSNGAVLFEMKDLLATEGWPPVDVPAKKHLCKKVAS